MRIIAKVFLYIVTRYTVRTKVFKVPGIRASKTTDSQGSYDSYELWESADEDARRTAGETSALSAGSLEILGGAVERDQPEDKDCFLEFFGPEVEAVELGARRAVGRKVVDHTHLVADGMHLG